MWEEGKKFWLVTLLWQLVVVVVVVVGVGVGVELFIDYNIWSYDFTQNRKYIYKSEMAINLEEKKN